MVRRTWQFSLEWVLGGEYMLQDEEQGNYQEWMMRIERPWWEPEQPQQPDQPLGYYQLLLPIPLLAPFTENSTWSGIFPTGYYCTACGRINVQCFLRHRICEGKACNSTTDPQRETGWAINALFTQNLNSAKVAPDDKWDPPWTTEHTTAFEDGARLYWYQLAAVGDSCASPAPLSARHVFNGNRELLQRDASALFEMLQRDVLIERRIGVSVFATPQIEIGSYSALGPSGHRIWDQQATLIESALSRYCHDLGPLKVQALRVQAWVSDGKVRTYSSRLKRS